MSKRAFLTGVTGFIGNAVARELLSHGYQIRALVRPNSDLRLIQDLPLELVYGDLRDKTSFENHLKDCNEVYHVAAQYSFYNPNPAMIYESNVTGTQNLLTACTQHNIEKIIYTSTVGAIGIPPDGIPGNEKTPLELHECKGHYKRSKFLAELEAIKFAKLGLPIVIVNPSAPIGVRDAKPTPTGQMIVDFLNRKMPAYLDTGLNLIDVEDVARGHYLASLQGKIGERYILGNKNLHLKEILLLLSEITGLSAPKFKIPFSVALASAYFSEFSSRLLRRPPQIAIEAVQLGRKKMFFDASKAVLELALPQTDIKVALQKAVHWYVKNGYVKPKYVQKIIS
ncbi:MAG: NAD-dependent epimerase/dehydratase family protein [Deltaproteobacteria bacterium]|nr:NAD-dependent epimerase/dehydratase family protein [Deltaproteobacteria bacterium]